MDKSFEQKRLMQKFEEQARRGAEELRAKLEESKKIDEEKANLEKEIVEAKRKIVDLGNKKRLLEPQIRVLKQHELDFNRQAREAMAEHTKSLRESGMTPRRPI